MTEDPLLELVVDAVEVDRQRIADALRNVIAIDKGGQVLPARRFGSLSAAGKVVAFLLGRKVAVLVDLAEDEAIGPTQLAQLTGMAEGTVFPTVRRLGGDRLISQDADSAYFIASHQVGNAIEMISGGGEDDDEAGSNAKRTPRRRPRRARAVEQPAESADPTAATDGDTQAEELGSTKVRRASSGFSPTNEVRALIERGFFAEPRTLTDLQRHFKDRQGREVAAGTLSPVMTRLLRAGALDRDRRDDESYEYSTPGDE